MPTPIADLLGLIPHEGTEVTNNTTLRIAQKDIGNIRLNMMRGNQKIDSQIYTTRVMGKAKTFGGYASIIAGGFKTASYAKQYEAGKKGQYDGADTYGQYMDNPTGYSGSN